MLEQVLRDLYIDPQLLAELDEEQQQILFFKMRQEQIRRWKEWDTNLPPSKQREKFRPTKPRIAGHSKVGFLVGSDGKPWTWVMGEHTADVPLENIQDEVLQDRARKMAEEEIRTLTKVDNRAPAEQVGTKVVLRAEKPVTSGGKSNEERSSEIYEIIKQEQRQHNEKILEENQQLNQVWLEQEKKAKKLEEDKRIIVRLVRTSLSQFSDSEESSRSFSTDYSNNTVTSEIQSTLSIASKLKPKRPEKPANIADIISWFQDVEKNKAFGKVFKSETIPPPWFHGIISREEAETLLAATKVGSFLVRVSDKIWGYTISYKSAEKIKHFLIDASHVGYQFIGVIHYSHTTLVELIDFHKTRQISLAGRELLQYPCGQSKIGPPDYLPLVTTLQLDDEEVSHL